MKKSKREWVREMVQIVKIPRAFFVISTMLLKICCSIRDTLSDAWYLQNVVGDTFLYVEK